MSWYVQTCTECDRSFDTKKARYQHFMSKHYEYGGQICEYCLKITKTANGLEHHTSSKHVSESLTEKEYVTKKVYVTKNDEHDHEDPYDGIEGYWVRRSKFRSSGKSFGYFQCPSCDNEWMSAHAFSQYNQGCQECEQKSLPCCLWKNTANGRSRSMEEIERDKPHDCARCEACRRGVCQRREWY